MFVQPLLSSLLGSLTDVCSWEVEEGFTCTHVYTHKFAYLGHLSHPLHSLHPTDKGAPSVSCISMDRCARRPGPFPHRCSSHSRPVFAGEILYWSPNIYYLRDEMSCIPFMTAMNRHIVTYEMWLKSCATIEAWAFCGAGVLRACVLPRLQCFSN